MFKKKAGINFYNILVILAMIGLAASMIMVIAKIDIIKEKFYGLVGIEKKCEETGKTLEDYKIEIGLLFENPIESKGEIIQQCDEVKSCFSKEYSSFKDRCDSVKT